MGLLAVILVMLLLSGIGTAMTSSSMVEMTISANDQHAAQAFYAADSGLEQIKVDLSDDTSWIVQVFDSRSMDIRDPFPDSLSINGNSLSVAKVSGEVVPGYYTFGTGTSVGNGSYARQIGLPATAESANAKGNRVEITLPTRSLGAAGSFEVGGQIVRADTVVIISRITPWDNAIFAGDRVIDDPLEMLRDGVEIHGSVHVLGNPSNPSVTEVEDSFDLVNHYDGIDDAAHFGTDATKLPGLPTTTLPNGDVVASLNAEFRVQDGSVLINGNASLGQTNVDGNGLKETLDGFYVDGGVSGGSGSELNADDVGGYDMADDEMNFPALSDPFVDPDTGTSYASHTAYLSSKAMDFDIDEISGDVGAFHAEDGNGNLIDWDPDTGILQIEGIVRSTRDVLIGDSSGGGDATGRINYTGTGTIWAPRIELRHDLMPLGNYLDVEGGGTVHNIGLIADDRLSVATGDGSRPVFVMAAMYAGTEFRIDRIGRIAGTVMAPEFHKSRGFEIYQVPSLASNLPPGMPDDRRTRMVGVGLSEWYHER